MIIGLISGHGDGDCGAVGCGYQEADLTIEVVQKLDALLRGAGHETVVYPYERDAFKDAKNGGLVVDFSNCVYVLEVHFNSCVNDQIGNGDTTGIEIYVTPRESAWTVEDKILNKIAKIGFKNRGVKKEDYLVINTVKSLGVSSALIETCFIDDKDDMDLYEARKDDIAKAIVNGILEGFGVIDSDNEDSVVETPVDPAPVPEPTVEPDVILSVNIGGSEGWLGEVHGCDSDIYNEATGYAGMGTRTVEGVCIRLENANFSLRYAVHILNGRTLGVIDSKNADTSNEATGYAGIIGQEIDGITMFLDGTDKYDVEYQVKLKDGRILDKVRGCNSDWNDFDDGYAGIFGNQISGITARIVER